MKIGICADSACDLPAEVIKKNNIFIVPFIVLLGDEEHVDGYNITPKDIFEHVEKTGELPKTTAINSFTYEEKFKEILKSYDAVIHISLSSAISSAYNNAVTAAKQFKNVEIIDSKSLSSGEGLVVLSAVDKLKENKDFKTICYELKDEIERVQASFIINNLKYLHKGGRCKGIELFGSNLLRIKPKIQLVNGKMDVGKKYMGKLEDVLLKYTEDLLKDDLPDKKRCFVTYSSCEDKVKTKIVKRLREFGFQEIYTNEAGATICSHCGPETLGVLYIKTDISENVI